MRFNCARDLFESASEASRDAERCRKQLDAIEQRALSIGGPSLDAHVRGGGETDRIGRDVAALVDRERELYQRIEDDYRLIDLACAVLYGKDGMSDGLASIAPPWWADALWHHYLALTKWEDVAAMLDYAPRNVMRCAYAGLDLIDSVGLLDTIDGTGIAEE